MRKQRVRHIFRRACSLGALLSLVCAASFGLSLGGDFEIVQSTIDSGGGRSAGGDYTLTGSIGQADAASTAATGGDYRVSGGFWANDIVVPSVDALFSDGFESR